jgi:signal peptidase I
MREVGLTHEEFAPLAAEILGRGETLRFRARGASMRPTIRDGDVVEVGAPEEMRHQVGDVVLFEGHRDSVLAHRVLRLRKSEGRTDLQMQGDALLTPDGWVWADRILGIVTRVERDGKLVSLDTGWQRLRGRLWHWRWWLFRQCSRTLGLVRSMRQVSAEGRLL